MKRLILASLVVLIMSACSSQSTAPSAIPVAAAKAPEAMFYSINIPNAKDYAYLIANVGASVKMPPLEAQHTWDYTAAYGGSPNVYYGETAPHCGQYQHTGIVVAPLHVADLEQFTSADWPSLTGLTAGVTYQWIGEFELTFPGAPGTYVSDPASTLCPQP